VQSIDEYVALLPVNRTERSKTKQALELMSEILANSGRSAPENIDMIEYGKRTGKHGKELTQEMQRIDGYYNPRADAEDSRPSREKEQHSERMMIYLTPSLLADIRDWCSLKDMSYSEYISGLISTDMKDKQEKLKGFRELRDNA